MKSKIKLTLILVLASLLLISVLVGCVNHEHKYGEWKTTKEPTCIESGSKKRVCETCGDEETEVISALGHDYVDYLCTRCGEELPTTSGLEYTLNDDGESYSVTGIGTAKDTDIVIAPTYEGKPVTGIGRWAFGGCRSITSVKIPDSVTSIGFNAFADYKPLKFIEVSKENRYYKSVDGNLYNKEGTELIKYAIGKKDTTFVIPDSVINICAGAFECGIFLTSVTIPDSVTYIGNGAFINCSKLASITIPNSVTSIGMSAFNSCSSLTRITIPNSVTSIGDAAFSGCESLKCNVRDNVKYLGNEGNLYLVAIGMVDKTATSLVIENSCRFIRNSAFYYCDNLTSVTIPDSVTSIGDLAFANCSSLTTINYIGSEEEWNAISKGGDWDYGTGEYMVVYNYKI